jgi:hypothetical protein
VDELDVRQDMEEYIVTQKYPGNWEMFPLRSITHLRPLQPGGSLSGGLFMHWVMGNAPGEAIQLSPDDGDKLLEAINTSDYFRCYCKLHAGECAFRIDHITSLRKGNVHETGQLRVVTISTQFKLSNEDSARLFKQLGINPPPF